MCPVSGKSPIGQVCAIAASTRSPSPRTNRAAMRTRGYSFQLAVAGLIVVADQLTKLVIRREFELYDSAAVIPNLFSLTRIHNTGAAFGLLDGVDLPFKTALLAVVSVAALAGLVMFAVSLPEIHRLARAGVALVVGG